MTKTINRRMTVKLEGDFVVFLIGMRINKFWKIHQWLPVARAMPRMPDELRAKNSRRHVSIDHTGPDFINRNIKLS